MGYKIYVDHSRFKSAADKINEYIGTIDSYVTSMNSSVESLNETWQGDDALSFQNKWKTTSAQGSTVSNMKEDLKNYADKLIKAADKYANAQISAINEANNLPRWW